MRRIVLASAIDFAGWRDAARRLATADVAPDSIHFTDVPDDELRFGEAEESADPASPSTALRVPRSFIELAEQGVLHRDADRFDLLYRMLWRLRTEPTLMALASDPDVVRLNAMVKSVRRDIHKMHAFVRFRRIETSEDGENFVAWYEPDHHTVEAGTPFFARRFATMNWTILTPECCAFHSAADGVLRFGPGADRASAPADDELEELWRRYYASTFNPARPKPDMMKREMPVRFWKNLPEAQLIEPLLREAGGRTKTMVETAPTEPVVRRGAEWTEEPLPSHATSLDALRAEAADCKLCPLWAPATQTVFGEGGAHAKLVFVGEQPGDQEDLAGHPFVGPAGQALDRALTEAGIDRRNAYVTNAVKHFKFEPRGKRRIHKKPSVGEIRACSTWLDRELQLIKPSLIVMLGASAAQAVLRRSVTIGRERGQPMDMGDGRTGFVTVHPSYILRVQGEDDRAKAYAEFVRDLREVASLAGLSAH